MIRGCFVGRRALGAFGRRCGGLRQTLLFLMMLLASSAAQYSVTQAQSGWYHCDIQDHSYTGPGTRYFCRPVSFDWLCNIARITSFCGGNTSRGDNRGSGASVASRSAITTASSMNIRRIGGAGIGVQWIIDAGFIDAFDVWGDDVRGEVCLDGAGSLLFLDAGSAPRAQIWLDSAQRDGQTCATLDRAGTLVLMPAGSRYQDCRIITTGHLRLRASPSAAAEIIGYVPSGESPRMLMRNSHWFNVEYLEKEGWLGARYVRVDCDRTIGLASGAAQWQGCGIITTGHLKLRAEPSAAAEIIGYVPRGESPRALSRNEHWFNVEYLVKEGWISARYVRVDCDGTVGLASAAAQWQGCGIITTGHLKLRAEPSVVAEIVDYVPRGESLRALSRSEHWFNVEYKGKAGWIGAGFATTSADCG